MRKHKTYLTQDGVFYEIKLIIPRPLYLKLKFYQNKTQRPIEDLIMEVLKGCIDSDPQ
ncbi:MAG: hypothetical protein ACO2OZ_03355 [Acidilobaceae archaeon]|jgi:hypothetical protein